MNNGKNLEKLVKLIQETLKNIPETKILLNHRLENSSGRKREIDILLVTIINGMEIKIAIECKDYKNPVPVEKIEAFNSKCLRIKNISKKVFVSSSGYQADSFGAAEDFDIELYNLSEISSENITYWFQIQQLKPIIKIKLPYKIQIQGSNEEAAKIPNEELIVYSHKDNKPILITGFVWNTTVVPNQNFIQNYMILDFMKGKCSKDKNTILPFTLNHPEVYTILEENKKRNLIKIEAQIAAWFEETPINIKDAKHYNKVNSTPEASILTVNVGQEETVDIVTGNDNKMAIFRTTKNGQTYKLKTLASYDKETDKFSIKYDDNNNEC